MQQASVFFLLIQLFLCLCSIQLFSPIFEKLKAPKVFAEIFAGLLLGPTILKNLSPYFYQTIFVSNNESLTAFSGIQELGLLLLMFCSGLEVEILVKGKAKALSVVSGFLGVIFPFTIAYFLSDYFQLNNLLGENGNLDSLKYFFAICCAITSIPVISRIFIDLKLIHTKFANICLSIALVEDLILYAVMALFISIGAKSMAPNYLNLIHMERNSSLEIFLHVVLTVVMVLASFKFFPFFILKVKDIFVLKKIFSNYLTFSFLALLSISIVSIYLGIPAFLGSFLAGIIIAKTPLHNTEHLEHIKRFSFSTFIPLFFVGIGLKLDLIHSFDTSFFILFILFSSIIKIAGVTISGMMTKVSFKNSFNFGMALNARGGPGIVLASIGLSTKLINESFFVTLILTALITSWLAAFWLNLKKHQIVTFES